MAVDYGALGFTLVVMSPFAWWAVRYLRRTWPTLVWEFQAAAPGEEEALKAQFPDAMTIDEFEKEVASSFLVRSRLDAFRSDAWRFRQANPGKVIFVSNYDCIDAWRVQAAEPHRF